MTETISAAELREQCLRDELSALNAEQEAGMVSPTVAETIRLKLSGEENGDRLVSRFLSLEVLDPEAAGRCGAAVADAGMAPPFPVAGCELVAEQVFSLGGEFVKATGAFVFAHLGSVCLVAMPDPSNRRLRDAVEARLGECRFFRCRADEAQTVVDRAVDERRKGGLE